MRQTHSDIQAIDKVRGISNSWKDFANNVNLSLEGEIKLMNNNTTTTNLFIHDNGLLR